MSEVIPEFEPGTRLIVSKPVYFEKEDVTWLAGTEVVAGITFGETVFVSLPTKLNTCVGLNFSLLERAA